MNDFNYYRTVLCTALNVENFIYEIADVFKVWPKGENRFDKVLSEHLQLMVRDLQQPDLLTFAEYVKDYTDRQDLIKIASKAEWTANTPRAHDLAIKVYDDFLNGELERELNDKNDFEDFESAWSHCVSILDKYHDLSKGKKVKSMEVLGVSVIEQIQKAKASQGITGIETGYEQQDKLFTGYQPQNLIILAARPGMGKTSKALNEFVNIGKLGRKVAFFSLEMSAEQLFMRMVAQVSDVSLERMTQGTYSEDEFFLMNNAKDQLNSDNFNIIDDCLSISDIVSKIKILCAQGVEMVFIDYLQLIKGESKSKTEEITGISQGLKQCAKKNNIPILALSQLSRAVETRGGDKIPNLSDLRDSGAIEQDADIVAFLYRPEYYGLTEDENGNSTVGQARYIVAKNRHGRLETIFLRFEAEKTTFLDFGCPY